MNKIVRSAIYGTAMSVGLLSCCPGSHSESQNETKCEADPRLAMVAREIVGDEVQILPFGTTEELRRKLAVRARQAGGFVTFELMSEDRDNNLNPVIDLGVREDTSAPYGYFLAGSPEEAAQARASGFRPITMWLEKDSANDAYINMGDIEARYGSFALEHTSDLPGLHYRIGVLTVSDVDRDGNPEVRATFANDAINVKEVNQQSLQC